MGKRSSFERRERDFYPTPPEAVLPLLPFLHPKTRFCEPCAGDGALIRALTKAGHECNWASDIEPRSHGIFTCDALTLKVGQIDCFITNPPWSRDVLHPLIRHLTSIAPAWLLFDADWPHTKQSSPFMPLLHRIVSVGRVKWIPDSKFTGKDNCCWYLFDASRQAPAQFIGRAA
jgi:hypothetical protein